MQKSKNYLSWIFSLSILLIFVLCPKTYALSQVYSVRTVLDGDTIILENGEKIRYKGINTPEIAHKDQLGEPFGEQAKKRNSELVLDRQVRLDIDPNKARDRYGRLIADVFLLDGKNVSEILILEGFAYTCKYGGDGNDKLLKAQRNAIEARRGLWALSAYTEGKAPYPANAKSGIFHTHDCTFGKNIASRNKVVFRSKKEAFWEGFCPCKKCQP